ncbi:MAG: hypothetical protein LBF38_03520 [Deltaproteobacteria bacterium]|jgi:MraZ protein|nr:hypothetical protein [Deltaproteobacteria bacterium]
MPSVTVTFKGRQPHVMDEKGRLILPNQFRTLLTLSKDPCSVYLGSYPGTKFVSVYPSERWEELCESWKDEKRFPNTSVMLKGQRLFFSNIEHVSVDRTGRITIPSHFRERAQLKDEVMVIGVAEKMEIWNPAVLDEYENAESQTWGEIGLESARPAGQVLEEVRLPQF